MASGLVAGGRYTVQLMSVRAAVTTVLVVLVACSGGIGLPDAGNGAQKRDASVPYVDYRHHYRIDAPGQMSLNADGTASFIGISERLEVAIIERATAVDPAAVARKDSTRLASSLADFQLLSRPAAITLAGHGMVKFVYSWTATDRATGKRLRLTSVRYYVPKNQSVIAVVTYGMSAEEFDPQSADEVARSFRWQ